MSARRPAFHALLVACVLTGTLAVGCKGKGDAAKDTAVPAVLTVSVQPVGTRELPQKLDMTGSVAAWDPVPVMPAANGLRIMRVLAEEGDTVKQGQLLAQLDDASLQAQVAASRARAQSAEAQLLKMRQPTRRQDLASAEAAVSQAEANVSSALDAYQRFRDLRAEGGVSEAELVARQTALEAARATAEQARQKLSLAKEGSRSEDLRIAEAQAAEARASLQQAEAMLAQTRVTAPARGLLIKRDAHLGDVSSVGRALFQLVREGRLEVQATIPETDLGKVKTGQSVLVTSDARPDLHATGKIRLISSAVEAQSRQATVRIDVPANAGFAVGMFVRAQAQLGTIPTLAVPATAVVAKETGSEVFVLEGDLAKSRKVEAGVRAGDWVGIRDGLKDGEQVITAGVGFLKDGDKVDVAPALTSSTDGAASPAATATPMAAPTASASPSPRP